MALVECPNCNISYVPRLALCPRCKDFQTPQELQWTYLEQDALHQLNDGESVESVRRGLLNSGMPEFRVDRIISQTKSKVGWENRRIGLTRLVGGLAICVLGLIVCGPLLLAKDGAWVFLAKKIALVGILILLSGIWLVALGIWNLLSGKD
jgi:hypothetical protein